MKASQHTLIAIACVCISFLAATGVSAFQFQRGPISCIVDIPGSPDFLQCEQAGFRKRSSGSCPVTVTTPEGEMQYRLSVSVKRIKTRIMLGKPEWKNKGDVPITCSLHSNDVTGMENCVMRRMGDGAIGSCDFCLRSKNGCFHGSGSFAPSKRGSVRAQLQ